MKRKNLVKILVLFILDGKDKNNVYFEGKKIERKKLEKFKIKQ